MASPPDWPPTPCWVEPLLFQAKAICNRLSNFGRAGAYAFVNPGGGTSRRMPLVPMALSARARSFQRDIRAPDSWASNIRGDAFVLPLPGVLSRPRPFSSARRARPSRRPLCRRRISWPDRSRIVRFQQGCGNNMPKGARHCLHRERDLMADIVRKILSSPTGGRHGA